MAKKKKKKKRKLTRKGKWVFGIAGGLLFVLMGWFVYRVFVAPTEAEKEAGAFPIRGIDVSKHTGYIDWQKIKGQQVDFAYIKSTEGSTYLDPRFRYNLREAKEAGIPVGVYHFFRFHRSGKEQAENFLNHVNPDELDLPPVVDLEEWGQYNSSKNADSVSIELKIFIDAVEEESDRRVIIYSDKSSFRKYIQGKFEENEIWICSLNGKPAIEQDWVFWQYSHKGKLKGAQGKVDMNIFNGNRDEWEAYLEE